MPRVSINATNKTLQVNSGEILYDSLFDRGVELPHGCLSGSCGACRIEIISGHDQLALPGVIESNTIDAIMDELKMKYGENFVTGKIIRLSCRAKIAGEGNIIIQPSEQS
jgi:ferredoxin